MIVLVCQVAILYLYCFSLVKLEVLVTCKYFFPVHHDELEVGVVIKYARAWSDRVWSGL